MCIPSIVVLNMVHMHVHKCTEPIIPIIRLHVHVVEVIIWAMVQEVLGLLFLLPAVAAFCSEAFFFCQGSGCLRKNLQGGITSWRWGGGRREGGREEG